MIVSPITVLGFAISFTSLSFVTDPSLGLNGILPSRLTFCLPSYVCFYFSFLVLYVFFLSFSYLSVCFLILR
jgi:hypothetical protein